MPNWMYNNLTISGEEARVAQAEEQLAKAYEVTNYDLFEDKYETVVIEQDISFWNIVAPTDLVAYHDNPEHNQSNPDHWYMWNLRNWGTKWDASEVEVEERELGSITYRFSTPWGVPMEALTKLSEQYPDLVLSLHYEEEQGWGGDYEIENGVAVSTNEYEYLCHNCDQQYQSTEEVVFGEDGLHQCVSDREGANA